MSIAKVKDWIEGNTPQFKVLGYEDPNKYSAQKPLIKFVERLVDCMQFGRGEIISGEVSVKQVGNDIVKCEKEVAIFFFQDDFINVNLMFTEKEDGLVVNFIEKTVEINTLKIHRSFSNIPKQFVQYVKN